METQDIVRKVYEAGVVGAGGAGFPTHVKLGAKAEIVLVNGAECEPLLKVDQQLAARHAKEMVRGLALAMQAVGAREGIVALKAKYAEAIDAITPLPQSLTSTLASRAAAASVPSATMTMPECCE